MKNPAQLPCGRPQPQHRVESPKTQRELLERLNLQLEAFVKSRGLNRSEARTKILETIVSEARHFRAQDLLERLNRRHPEVGKATLYRNLPVLVESGLIQEGPTDQEGQILYELTDDDHHDHIVCLDCKRIFEFHDDLIEKKQVEASREMGFTLRNHRHVIYASCDFLTSKVPKTSDTLTAGGIT